MPKTLSYAKYAAIMSQDPDEWCVLLAMLGFSARLISEETGLSAWAVYARLHKRKVRITDYRNGTSPMARYVINSTAKLPARSRVDLEMHRTLYLPKPAPQRPGEANGAR